jgi:2'-5' RNA ligase
MSTHPMDRDPVTGVFGLPLLGPSVMYESALVFWLPPAEQAYVEALRCALDWPAPPEYQLVPHVTVLFLGRMHGSELVRLHSVLGTMVSTVVDSDIVGLGCFSSEETISNVHLRLEGRQLRQFHDRCFDACIAAGWQPQTPYVRDRYVPHVSVFDRVRMPLIAYPAEPPDLPRKLRLDEVTVIARVVGSSETD